MVIVSNGGVVGWGEEGEDDGDWRFCGSAGKI